VATRRLVLEGGIKIIKKGSFKSIALQKPADWRFDHDLPRVLEVIDGGGYKRAALSS